MYSENVTEVLSSDMFSKKLKQAVVHTGQKKQPVGVVEETGGDKIPSDVECRV